MTGKTVENVENRKNWVAPKLKKVDIELVTASYHAGMLHDSSSSHS